MAIFTLGNAACALAPDYWSLMAARVLTAFAHGTFFGVGSVVATTLVAPTRKPPPSRVMFTGLTVANILGVPFGTWLGQGYGWRSTFWAVTLIGLARIRHHRESSFRRIKRHRRSRTFAMTSPYWRGRKY